MSGVQDGQSVSAGVTNPAFIFKNGDDVTQAKLGLDDQGLGSGTAVTNAQQEFNALWNWLGGLVNQGLAYLPAWATDFFGATGDNIFQRVSAIDAAYDPSGGALASRAGAEAIGLAVDFLAVTFSTPWSDANYSVLAVVENTVDPNPIFMQVMITAKTASGFTAKFNAPTDTLSYKLNYLVRKAA